MWPLYLHWPLCSRSPLGAEDGTSDANALGKHCLHALPRTGFHLLLGGGLATRVSRGLRGVPRLEPGHVGAARAPLGGGGPSPGRRSHSLRSGPAAGGGSPGSAGGEQLRRRRLTAAGPGSPLRHRTDRYAASCGGRAGAGRAEGQPACRGLARSLPRGYQPAPGSSEGSKFTSIQIR